MSRRPGQLRLDDLVVSQRLQPMADNPRYLVLGPRVVGRIKDIQYLPGLVSVDQGPYAPPEERVVTLHASAVKLAELDDILSAPFRPSSLRSSRPTSYPWPESDS